MKCPPGLNFFHKNLVCKLIKSIYGLKQESRQCNNKLNQSLSKLGFQRSISYDSLFTKNTINYFTIILVYVDDLILTSNKIKEITYTKQFLDIKFSIKDLGHLKYFLEFEITKFSQDISLCQRKYTLDLLQKIGILALKPSTIPMDPTFKLQNNTVIILYDPTIFRSLIGKLLYLPHSKPNICFVMCRLS